MSAEEVISVVGKTVTVLVVAAIVVPIVTLWTIVSGVFGEGR